MDPQAPPLDGLVSIDGAELPDYVNRELTLFVYLNDVAQGGELGEGVDKGGGGAGEVEREIEGRVGGCETELVEEREVGALGAHRAIKLEDDVVGAERGLPY